MWHTNPVIKDRKGVSTMNRQVKEKRAFGVRDKIGYMFGDFGNDFTFIFASSFLMVFYTKVLGISTAAVGTLFLVARLVDAVTDVTMGRIVDRYSPKDGDKFRPWIKWMSGPVALASFLMYQYGMASATMPMKMLYMYVTYILWGSIFYTSINIPYGSMASVISADPNERTSLSTFRGVGATLAGLVIGVGVPLVIYTKDEMGNEIVNPVMFTVIAGVFSILAIVCYIICYVCTTERIKLEKKEGEEKTAFLTSLKNIFKNPALLAIIAAAIGLLLSQLITQNLNNYLFADYFKNTKALSLLSFFSTAVALTVAGITIPFSRRFGKKEISAIATLFSSLVFFVLFFLKITNVWIFVAISIVGFIGTSFFNMCVWANITDVIDFQELRTGERDDGTVYAVYSFARKVGQALAGGLGGYVLTAIGYDSLAKVQTAQVTSGIYNAVTIIPAICFFIVSMILFFGYPLNKKRVEENAEELRKRR